MKHGIYINHAKVEVYLLEFKLCLYSDLNRTKTKEFSRATIVGEW